MKFKIFCHFHFSALDCVKNKSCQSEVPDINYVKIVLKKHNIDRWAPRSKKYFILKTNWEHVACRHSFGFVVQLISNKFTTNFNFFHARDLLSLILKCFQWYNLFQTKIKFANITHARLSVSKSIFIKERRGQKIKQ